MQHWGTEGEASSGLRIIWILGQWRGKREEKEMCPGSQEEEDNMSNQDHWLGGTGCHPAPLTLPRSWVPWGQQSPAWPRQH